MHRCHQTPCDNHCRQHVVCPNSLDNSVSRLYAAAIGGTNLQEEVGWKLGRDVWNVGDGERDAVLVVCHIQALLQTRNASIAKIDTVLTKKSAIQKNKFDASTDQEREQVVHGHDGDDVEI